MLGEHALDDHAAALPEQPSAPPDLDAMLGQLAQQRPELAWMTQMIAAQRRQRAAAPPEADAPDPAQTELAALREELALACARAERMAGAARRLARDLHDARERLADLAAAFGACGLCWGEDAACPGCRGRGKPGRFAPDPALRLRFFAEPLDVPAASRTSTHPDQR